MKQCIIFLLLYINTDPFLQFKEVWLAIECKLVHKSYRMIIFEEYVGVNPFAIAPGSQQPKPVKVWRVLLGNNEFGHDEADDVSIFLFPLTLHMTVLADFDLVFSYAGSQGKY